MKRYLQSLYLLPYKLFCVYVFAPDPAILTVNHLGITPYGYLWYLTNWITWVNFNWYTTYLLLVDIPITMLAFKYLPTRPLTFYTAYSIWLWYDEFPNLSVYWFAQFGALNPIFTILSILTKLPLPYLQPAPFEYATRPYRLQLILHGHYASLISYILILMSWMYGFQYWFRNKKDK